MREIPAELVDSLRRARALETLAATDSSVGAHRSAIRATGAIILAATELGWRQPEIAAATGLSAKAVQKRLAAARRTYAGQSPALVFDAPIDHPPHPRSVLQRPVSDREWLTRGEAAQHAGCHPHTIQNWFTAGLLPHTQTDRRPYLFLRADLLRVMRAARYKQHGVDYSTLRQQLQLSDSAGR